MGRTDCPDLKTDYERALVGHSKSKSNSKSFNESEMARSSECTEQHAQKVIDSADIIVNHPSETLTP